MSDRRSERRIQDNRIRRQRELRKNFLLTVTSICLVAIFSISLNSFMSNAKADETKSYHKYYKSVMIERNDTLWSIAQDYMDDTHYDSADDYIREVKQMNSLKNDDIIYGEYLIIPYYVLGTIE